MNKEAATEHARTRDVSQQASIVPAHARRWPPFSHNLQSDIVVSMFHRWGVVFCALALLMVNGGCTRDATSVLGSAAEDDEGAALYVETAPVTIEDVELTVEAVGTLRARRRVEVRSETEAAVASVLVKDGQQVSAGSPLVRLDSRKLAAEVRLRQASLAVVRARAANAKSALERAQDLIDKGYIPQQEFDDARSRADAAAAEVAEAEASLALQEELLADADIRAPITGAAGECLVDPGDFVRKGDLLLTIVDIDSLEVEFAVPEENLAALHLGNRVAVTVPSYPHERFDGTITYIEPEVLPDTRSVRLKATLPNDARRLRPGQFATVRIVLALHKNAALVPEEAIVPQGDDNWVYVVENERSIRRRVTLGKRTAGRVEVTTGLDGSETVVINGQQRLRDRAPVVIATHEEARG